MKYDLIGAPELVSAARGIEEKEGFNQFIEVPNAQIPGAQVFAVEEPVKTPFPVEHYATIVSIALQLARQSTMGAIGRLDLARLKEQTRIEEEDALELAQAALNEFGEDSDEVWTQEAFEHELRLRGFPEQLAREHAQGVGAVLYPEQATPEGLSAALEIHLDADKRYMQGASLYMGRAGGQHISFTQIVWVPGEGNVIVPQAQVTLQTIH